LEETNSTDSSLSARKGNRALMTLSYDITVSTTFEAVSADISDLDFAAINPSNEKQHVDMELYEDGTSRFIIEELDFKQKIKIKHKSLPNNDILPITKTIINGTTAQLYNSAGKLVATEQINLANQGEMVDKIKEIGNKFSEEDINNTIATLQGRQFVDNLEEFIHNAPSKGIQVTDTGDNLVTLRMPADRALGGNETVLLIDRKLNKLVGTRIYSQNNVLLQSTLFAYDRGRKKALKAIRSKELYALPSGKKVNMITLSQIENLKFNLNI
jgi:hypothetical protein